MVRLGWFLTPDLLDLLNRQDYDKNRIFVNFSLSAKFNRFFIILGGVGDFTYIREFEYPRNSNFFEILRF